MTSQKYESSRELAYKADWEGGLLSFVFDYGLSADELPDDVPPDARELFEQLFAVESVVRKLEQFLDAAISDPDPED